MPSKYEPLAAFLSKNVGVTVELSFARIEMLIGGVLPPAAQSPSPGWRTWWGNVRTRATHVQATNGWLAAGWEVASIDPERAVVAFRRPAAAR